MGWTDFLYDDEGCEITAPLPNKENKQEEEEEERDGIFLLLYGIPRKFETLQACKRYTRKAIDKEIYRLTGRKTDEAFFRIDGVLFEVLHFKDSDHLNLYISILPPQVQNKHEIKLLSI